MHRVCYPISLLVIMVLLSAACEGNSWSSDSANQQCDPKTVYSLSSAKDYVVLKSTANNGGQDGCGLMPERLVGTSATITSGPPGLDATISLSKPTPSGPPDIGGLFQGNIACNHGKLTAVSGYEDNRCSYWLFQTADAIVTGTDQVELQMFAQISDRQGCSPAGDACHSFYMIELGRR